MRKILQQYKHLKSSWRYQLQEYLESSSLHGVSYIGEKDRPFRERFLWFCFTMAGAITTLVIISSLWEKFQTNPTITGLDTDFHSWEINFPTITFCDQTAANPLLVDQLLLERHGINETHDDYEYMKSFYNIITSLSYENIDKLKNFTNDQTLPQNNFREIVYDLAYHCEEMLFNCKLLGEESDCCKWSTGFSPVFTENGFCYIFNSKHSLKTWPWKKGELIDEKEFKVKRVHETDEKWSLKFYNNHLTNSLQEIYIHSDGDIPGPDMLPNLIWDGSIYKILFAAKETYTTNVHARQLSIKQRRCTFFDEIKLKTNNIYTYYSCTRQCRIEMAQKLCGCIPFFYSKFDNVKYCNLQELNCIINNKYTILEQDDCDCELGCSNTVYEVAKLLEIEHDALSALRNQTFRDIEIEFATLPLVRYKREVIFGWVDLLVSFGGIAGLFLGFSLLSGVEVIYYFTIRTFCMMYRNADELKKFEREIEKNRQIPNYDLSLTPYFIKPAEPGNGIQVLRSAQGFHRTKINRVEPTLNSQLNYARTNKQKLAWIETPPPFGIEFLN